MEEGTKQGCFMDYSTARIWVLWASKKKNENCFNYQDLWLCLNLGLQYTYCGTIFSVRVGYIRFPKPGNPGFFFFFLFFLSCHLCQSVTSDDPHPHSHAIYGKESVVVAILSDHFFLLLSQVLQGRVSYFSFPSISFSFLLNLDRYKVRVCQVSTFLLSLSLYTHLSVSKAEKPNHQRWYAKWKLSWNILHNGYTLLHVWRQFVCSVGAY